MNSITQVPVTLAQLSPSVQVMALLFIGWALIMFLVLHIDGTRAK